MVLLFYTFQNYEIYLLTENIQALVDMFTVLVIR